jgi:hypothetical protein
MLEQSCQLSMVVQATLHRGHSIQLVQASNSESVLVLRKLVSDLGSHGGPGNWAHGMQVGRLEKVSLLSPNRLKKQQHIRVLKIHIALMRTAFITKPMTI